MRRLRLLPMLLLAALSFLVISCDDLPGGLPLTSEAKEPEAPAVTFRQDCNEIYGTAFRSADETQWYADNCMKWPPVSVAQNNPGTLPPDPPECAGMRGKPYTSEQQRVWFLQNCGGAALLAQEQRQGANPPVTTGPDRTDCNQIRGTAYRSANERNWFIQNCPAVPATTGPDRTNCDEIRGTPYRSDTERAWFIQNCPATTNPPANNNPPITIVPQQPSNPNSGGNNGNSGSSSDNNGNSGNSNGNNNGSGNDRSNRN